MTSTWLATQRAHDLQIMADEEIGEPALRLQIAQQIDDLRLHAHIECGGGLIEHHEFRIERHGASNGDALALPPENSCG